MWITVFIAIKYAFWWTYYAGTILVLPAYFFLFRSHRTSWVYRNKIYGFEMILPARWDQGLLGRYNPTFYGPSGASIKIAIGPIPLMLDVQTQQANLARIARKYGHRILEVGAIEVCGKEHATMLVEIPGKGILKHYSLLFNNIEYLVSTNVEMADSIVQSFTFSLKQQPSMTPTNKVQSELQGMSILLIMSFLAIILLRYFGVITWSWYIVGFIAAAMLMVHALISAIRVAQTPRDQSSFQPQTAMPTEVTHLIEQGAIMPMHVQHLISQGDFHTAEEQLMADLERIPPVNECTGIIAQQRFHFLLSLADILRKQGKDVERELELLNECDQLLKKAPLPPLLPGPDRELNFPYMMQMNRSIAAGKLGQYLREEEALSKAFQAARDPETRCKCLSFQVWAILKQQDESKFDLAWRLVEQFDELAAGQRIPSELRVGIETGRVVLALSRNDLVQARKACAEARHIDPPFPGIRELTQILTDPNVTAKEAREQIMKLIMDNIARQYAQWRPIKTSLSPLTIEEFNKEHTEQSLTPRNDSTVSDREFKEFENRAQALSDAGRHEECEHFIRQMLIRHTQPDSKRLTLLTTLGRALMRQAKDEEALQAADQAIALAHQIGDVLELIFALDLRAEILCFDGEYPEALRTLAEADRYLREGQINNPRLEAWLAHTRGMIYTGCGFWDKAAEHLRKAMQSSEYLRQWSEWAGAYGDFVNLIRLQADVEGANLDVIKNAISDLNTVHSQFEFLGNRTMVIQTDLHKLMLRTMQAELTIDKQIDKQALLQVRDELRKMNELHGPHGFFVQPANFGLHLAWTEILYRVDRTCIDWNILSREEQRAILEAQLQLITVAVNKAPDVRTLWIEKARTHLYRGRYDLDQPSVAVQLAAESIEIAMEKLRKETAQYAAPHIRSQWLSTHNTMIDALAEIALFALKDVTPPDNYFAEKMICLIQELRGRARTELVRMTQKELQQFFTENPDINDVVIRIRYLNRWITLLEEKGQVKPESPCRNIRNIHIQGRDSHVDPEKKEFPDVSIADNLDPTLQEIFGCYAEYTFFQERRQVERELEAREMEFDHRLSQAFYAEHVEKVDSFNLTSLQTALHNDIVLDYCVGASTVHVAVITQNSIEVLRLPIDHIHSLHSLAKYLLPPEHNDELPQAVLLNAMQQFSNWFFPKELMSLLEKISTTRLYIVASGPLWRIPFAWLEADGKLALQRWEICVVPSAQLAGRSQEFNSVSKAFAVGHPGLPGQPDLNKDEELEQELAFASLSLDEAPCFHKEATPSHIIHHILPQADVIHFGCHGICDPVSPLMSSLQLEPDPQHQDGRLFLWELLGNSLNATLVNLSACHSARTDGSLSFPESLAHGLLGVGTRYVLASLWSANNKESVAFNQDFYKGLRQLNAKEDEDIVTAFNRAQLEQLKRAGLPEIGKIYLSMTDEDFAKFGNFVLFSAKEIKQPDILTQKASSAPHCYLCAKEGHFREMILVNNVMVNMKNWDKPWNPTQSCYQCANCGRLTCYTHCDDREPCECGAKNWQLKMYLQKELDNG